MTGMFIAEKGKGVQIYENGIELHPRLSTNTELEKAAWTFEIAGRPSDIVTGILSEAIDASSIRGGVFIFNSTAYSLTRLVAGQLSAVIDIGARIIKDIPGTRERFIKAGFGTVMGLFPYDFAAGVLIAQEAGCIITDAYGKSLEEASLLESSEKTIRSIVAASSPELQRQFLSAIEAGFNRFLRLKERGYYDIM